MDFNGGSDDLQTGSYRVPKYTKIKTGHVWVCLTIL